MRRIVDYFLLFLTVLPNLIWVLLDRSIWPSDTSLYGLHSMRLYLAWGHDALHWWEEMFSLIAKPPLLPWIGQFFVPLGKGLGNIDSGLLLINIICHYIALLLVFEVLVEYFEKKIYAYAGCLAVASAPTFIMVPRQFYVQPLQLAIVAWFVYPPSQKAADVSPRMNA